MAIGFVPEGQADSSKPGTKCLESRGKWPRPSGTIEPILLTLGLTMSFGRPSGTEPLYVDTQALRAWLLSTCPSGTKAMQFLFAPFSPGKRL